MIKFRCKKKRKRERENTKRNHPIFTKERRTPSVIYAKTKGERTQEAGRTKKKQKMSVDANKEKTEKRCQ